MTRKEFFSLLFQGGPGFCQIAVTNACNARCTFCNFHRLKPEDWIMADPARLRQGLPLLAQGGIKYIVFTGGEPLLYSPLTDLLAQARDLDITTLLCTNGALLSSAKLSEFQEAGLDSLIISIDAASSRLHDEHRGLPGLADHIRAMVPEIKQRGIKPIASVTISRLLTDLPALPKFLAELGFRLVTFSYPLTRVHSSYLGCADHDLVKFSPAELYSWFEQIKDLKSQNHLQILNPRRSLIELQRQLTNHRSRFPCLAGYKYFFLDWELRVYRCHYLKTPLGALEDFLSLPRIRDDCQACMIDCYRDPSVYQYAAVSLADAFTALGQGQLRKALGHLFHPLNFLSLASWLEGLHWIRD
ncbi:MAG: radical SAM protein [Deltaproteobacteria bacterium]|nr:radical SAM protein [Deltaproteobacteria bacterium]MBW1951886.1 radical SAM protein [Deltaproteobacteria bacterium]MBW1986972.1 radical SAM protein [Deltaproteobacteria bacterium]MBW2134487.1 radical SAM protein [Deltaproteobacteria bacterium]